MDSIFGNPEFTRINTNMAKELKRRDLSGIYIFDTFPGESKRQPT